jgi:hypothetical protein
MIVYGDPQHVEMMSGFIAQLRARLEAIRRSPAHPSCDRLRTLLIMAGQLEQAVHDTPSARTADEQRTLLLALHGVTAHAAAAFHAVWAQGHGAAPTTHLHVQRTLAEMASALNGMRPVEGTRLTMKVPEGFAFHALYPEQYAASAARWVSERAAASPRQAIVVGIRTIGTALAAVVGAALTTAGWHVQSLTVRPSGHPFARTVELDPAQIGGADWALVVDEGPGLSGSSMAAVAEALVRAGMQRSRISFFPGHSGEPGIAASEAVRRWWATTPRYVTPLQDVRVDGLSLFERLGAAVSTMHAVHHPVITVEDVSGGLWRNLVYPSSAMWPPACAPFERPKYRCTTARGQRFLCKFAGLNLAPGGSATMAEMAAARMEALAKRGLGPSPLGVVDGFVVIPWVEGRPLTSADADAATLAHIGCYLAQAAGSPLASGEEQGRAAQLMAMLSLNAAEALGEAAAECARYAYKRMSRTGLSEARRAYGDGHLSPHEWLRTPSGRLVRVGNTGHDFDHTIVGRQSVAWDVAGALVEWRLDGPAAAPLLEAFCRAGGDRLPPTELTFYRLAYAAFRAGQCKLCADADGIDTAERLRLRRAYERYRHDLAQTLAAVSSMG